MIKATDYNVCSGKAYCVLYNESTGIPEDLASLAKPENLLAHIKGGATLSYKPTFYEDHDDLEEVSIMFPTKEEVTFKTKFITWNAEVLEKLCQTAVVENNDTTGEEIIDIGGAENFKDNRYILYFVGEGAAANGLKILMKGYNKAGFDISFVKDNATQPEMEFVCEGFKKPNGKTTKARIFRKGQKVVQAPDQTTEDTIQEDKDQGQ